MASTATSLSCSLPKFSIAKQFSNRKNPNSAISLAAPSPFLQHNTPMIIRFSSVVARVYERGDSRNTLEIDNNGENGEEIIDNEIMDDGIEIEIENTGKNSRRIRSKVVVQASLEELWGILTDYERLADFIPGLVVSQLVEKRDKFARLFQTGEQNLAFGLKFNAKGTIDCFEKELQTLPFGQKRDIEFKMVEGDFQLFEGKWSVEQGIKCSTGDLENDSHAGQTTLVYIVDVKPKLWLPVRLVEGRLCKEIRTNLSCIRKEAEKALRDPQSSL